MVVVVVVVVIDVVVVVVVVMVVVVVVVVVVLAVALVVVVVVVVVIVVLAVVERLCILSGSLLSERLTSGKKKRTSIFIGEMRVFHVPKNHFSSEKCSLPKRSHLLVWEKSHF